MGHPVIFETNPECLDSIDGCGYISDIDVTPGECHVNLDNAYELHPRRRFEHYHNIFLSSAARQLRKRGIEIEDFWNVAPEIEWPHQVAIGDYPRPWIMVCPRSNSFANKSVDPTDWMRAGKLIKGTCFWTGTYPAPGGHSFIDLKIRTIAALLTYLNMADLVVSVDTGPLHMAAALKKPIIAIGQASDPELHLSDQRDFRTIYPALDCLNCQEHKCPIADDAPCRKMEPEDIARAVEERLNTAVSAIVCVYRPSDRLDRCIEAALPQVHEIVIALDGNATLTNKWGPKVKIIPSTGKRLGYGRTANRGARNSNGHWLLMLNDDAYLLPDAVLNMRKAANNATAVVGCLMRYPDGTIQHGGTLRRQGEMGWGHLDHKKLEPTLKEPCEMEFVCLACAIVRRDAFYQVDGYDEAYDCYSEDADLCLKIRRNGWKVMYTPIAEAIHEDGSTTGDMKGELGRNGRKIFREKWDWYLQLNRDNHLGRFE